MSLTMASSASAGTDLVVLIRANAFGGSERHTVELVNFLAGAGWRVVLVQSGLDLRGHGLREAPGRLEVVSTQLPMRAPGGPECREWERLLRAWPSERALVVKPWYYVASVRFLQLVRRLYPQVYHIEHSLPPELGKPSRRLHFGVVPGLGLWWYRDLWNRWRMSRTVDRVLAVSEESRQRLSRDALHPSGRLTACPNGVDLEFWGRDEKEGQGFRRRHGIAEDTYLFGVVGRLVPLKGVDLALRAFSLLNPGQGRSAFCVAGDGPSRDELERLARELGVADRVHFVGHLRDVRAAYSALDTLLLPSTSESFPLALLEAMASGCRPVASSVGGVPEVLCDPGCGDLLASRDPDDWAKVMERHLSAPPDVRTRLAAEVREFTARNHDQRQRFRFLESVLFGASSPAMASS